MRATWHGIAGPPGKVGVVTAGPAVRPEPTRQGESRGGPPGAGEIRSGSNGEAQPGAGTCRMLVTARDGSITSRLWNKLGDGHFGSFR